jgi:hypothetical protein
MWLHAASVPDLGVRAAATVLPQTARLLLQLWRMWHGRRAANLVDEVAPRCRFANGCRRGRITVAAVGLAIARWRRAILRRRAGLVVKVGAVEGYGAGVPPGGARRESGAKRGVYLIRAGAAGGVRRLNRERAADVGEDGPDYGRVLHDGDDTHPAAAAGTGEDRRRTSGASNPVSRAPGRARALDAGRHERRTWASRAAAASACLARGGPGDATASRSRWCARPPGRMLMTGGPEGRSHDTTTTARHPDRAGARRRPGRSGDRRRAVSALSTATR